MQYQHYTSPQAVADRLTTLAESQRAATPTALRLKRAAMSGITAFEAGVWYPGAFEQAVADVGQLTVSADTFAADSPWDAISDTLTRYAELTAPPETVASDPLIFDSQRAAAYLGISKAMLSAYVYKYERIKPQTVGGAHAYTKAQLDAFKATMRPAGNPNFRAKRGKAESAE